MSFEYPAASSECFTLFSRLAALIALVAGGSVACATSSPPENVDVDATSDVPDTKMDGIFYLAEPPPCDGGPDATAIACTKNGRPLPVTGAACGPGVGDCYWTDNCGIDHFSCCGKKWSRVGDPPPSCSLCPSAVPTIGAPCSATGGLTCYYPDTIGGTRYCDWIAFECPAAVWDWSARACAPECPTAKPTNGATCPSTAEGKYCEWSSDCHNRAYGLCSGGKWAVPNRCP